MYRTLHAAFLNGSNYLVIRDMCLYVCNQDITPNITIPLVIYIIFSMIIIQS